MTRKTSISKVTAQHVTIILNINDSRKLCQSFGNLSDSIRFQIIKMATGGAPFDGADEEELPHWATGNGILDDRLNNMDWDVPQKKANRSSEKNKKKFSGVVASRLTNDISPESTPGAGRRKARTPHSFPPSKFVSQMSVPEQAELDRLKQRINFTDLDERSIGSDSQGRVTAANNQRKLSENKKAFNVLPRHVNTHKSKEQAAAAGKDAKKQGAGEDVVSGAAGQGSLHTEWASLLESGAEGPGTDSSQVVSRLVQIREYIAMACCVRDDLVEKNDIPANIEHLTLLIDHLKEQEKACLKFLRKLLARENEEDDIRTIDSAVGSESVAESTSLNIEVHSEVSDATTSSHSVRHRPRIEDNLGKRAAPAQGSLYGVTADAAAASSRAVRPDAIVSQQPGQGRERLGTAAGGELENLQRQHELLQTMLLQQEQLRALQGRQAALLAMQQKAEQAIAVMDETIVTETTGSVSGISITSELNEELNDLIQRFHNQLDEPQQVKAVPDNRRQAQSLSLTQEVSNSRADPAVDRAPLPSAQLAKIQGLLGKKKSMDKILQELHTLRDEALNNGSCQPVETLADPETTSNPAQKLRKLKEVHKRLNELRELVNYYEQTSNMMTDAVNENVRDVETEEESIFEPMFDSEQENREPVTNIRNSQRPVNWMGMNSLTGDCGNGNLNGRLNTEQEINNRVAMNLRSLNIPSTNELRYDREHSRGGVPGSSTGRFETSECARGRAGSSGNSRRSSCEEEEDGDEDPEFLQKVQRLRTAKEKLRHLQQLVAMVQSDDTDDTAANDDDRLTQQPNNTRAAPKPKKALALSEKEREKVYEAKLKRQQEELNDKRQRLKDIKAKIQDFHWACPSLQPPAPVPMGQAPAITSTPAVNGHGVSLNRTVEPTATAAPGNKLWAEMHRHQILREHLRQRRKHLESLMKESQRRKVLNDDSPLKGSGTPPRGSERTNRDDRMMSSWGGPSPAALSQRQEVTGQLPAGLRAALSGSERGRLELFPGPATQQQQQRNRSRRRQENSRWASDLSFGEERQQLQEQVAELQKQLDFSTSVCQTLVQDQQALSLLLPSLMSAPYCMLPSSSGSSQVQIVVHQLNQSYAQLAWQQGNIQRLQQVLRELQRAQDQSEPVEGGADQDTSPAFAPLNLPPPLNTINLPVLGCCPYLSPAGFGYSPAFPPAVGELYQNHTATQYEDISPSARTESLGFPQPFESSPASADKRNRSNMDVSGGADHTYNEKKGDPLPTDPITDGQRGGARGQLPPRVLGGRQMDEASVRNPALVPDSPDPITGTRIFSSKNASAQSHLASRDKTPKIQSKRRRSRTHSRRTGCAVPGQESDSMSSVSDHIKEQHSRSREAERPEKILEKLTREKLSNKPAAQNNKDLSSAYAWRTPFLSNRIACTEVQDNSSDFSLFEALREIIYSEVATLISQNESRPHFLIELFHELQLLNTDYLRQRALFALQDIVSRHLTEKDGVAGHTSWAASNSEMTPSESVATSDADVCEKNMVKAVHSGRNEKDDGSLDESTLSTCSYLDPFASDDLGNTVIHLDKALARIREYDRVRLSDSTASADPASNPASSAVLTGALEGQKLIGQMLSGVRCPQIDTQQLDRQIKDIMSQVLPFLQERMEEVCSTKLLASIRRMVLRLTQQHHESKEFVRFFHKQLGSILQESLSKFLGQKLCECGEDLLVAISETLFNELAFFRLMQDLDRGATASPERTVRKRTNATRNPPNTGNRPEEDQSFCESFLDEDKDKDDTEKVNVSIEPEAELQRNIEGSEREEEDDDDESEGLPLSIRLSKAETQPLTNYGSGEDENEDEELEEFEAGPVDVQTSLQASEPASQTEQNGNEVQEDVKLEEAADEHASVKSSQSEPMEEAEHLSEERESSKVGVASITESRPAPELPPCTGLAQPHTRSSEATPTGSPNTDSPVMINEDEVGSGNFSQKSDEDDFVRVEDLPLRLNVLSEEELKRTAKEQQPSSVSPDNPGEQSSDQTVKEAETLQAQSA
ncbi:hypothetical protein GJAV_G00165270 [Gymnothorax javanicus]|nr:hypothetical protein GJAV_G00165270 [Gymnothorax javanicus]